MDRGEALAKAKVVAEVAQQYASETEQLRHLAPPVSRAIAESGLGGLVSPTALGGDAIDPSTLVEVVETIAAADASTGWCVGIGSGSNFLAGILSRGAAEELFTDVSWPGVGPFEPTARVVRNGEMYNLNGRWRYSSNCTDGGVMAAGTFLDHGAGPVSGPDGNPIPHFVFLSRDQYEIEETWDTVGMRGTGSHDTIATDIKIPLDRVATMNDEAWPDDTLFRLHPISVLPGCLSPVAFGIATAALELVRARARAEADNPPPGRRTPLGEDPVSQTTFAAAEMRLNSTRALMYDLLGRAWDYALKGDQPPRYETAMLGLVHVEAMKAGSDVVDACARLMGTASVREGSRLDRLRRDIDTARQHYMFSQTHPASLGRQLAGLETVAFPYLPPVPG